MSEVTIPLATLSLQDAVLELARRIHKEGKNCGEVRLDLHMCISPDSATEDLSPKTEFRLSHYHYGNYTSTLEAKSPTFLEAAGELLHQIRRDQRLLQIAHTTKEF